MSIVKWYTRLLLEKPIRTKGITALLIGMGGDCICQALEGRKEEKLDLARTFRAGMPALVNTPLLHFQFVHAMPYLFPAKTVFAMIQRIIYDAVITAPIATTNFFVIQDILRGKSFEEIKALYKKKFLPTVFDNWKFWPFIMIINFTVIPAHYRNLVASLAGLFWATYLSYVQNVYHKNI